MSTAVLSHSSLEVLAPGPLALVQDLGRHGHLAVGVGRAGAADRASYELGQRLLGNREGAAALEVTLGGLWVRARGDLLVCLTGAVAPGTIDGRQVPYAAPVHLRDGAVLRLAAPQAGLRTYLSVRGGFLTPEVLGSRSTDTMSGLGPAPLAAGDALPVGSAPIAHPSVDQAPVSPPTDGRVTLRVTPGPRRDWFADPAALQSISWRTSEHSDRRGVRLTGGFLARVDAFADCELTSEGMVRGAIQVPPDGAPVILLNDHPVTGGYPVIGVVRSADVDLAAQLTPGQEVSFRWEEPNKVGS